MTSKSINIKIGVLALQGAFEEHIEMLESIGIDTVEIRLPHELQGLDGLILPGGESTTMSKLLGRWNLMQPIREWVKKGKPIWGTCAGMILLSDTIGGGGVKDQESIGGLHAVVHRNIFGAQVHSFETQLKGPPGFQDKPYHAVFIRAPALVTIHSDMVQVLEHVEYEGNHQAIVAAQQNNVLVTAFHPELTKDTRWHRYFVSLISKEP